MIEKSPPVLQTHQNTSVPLALSKSHPHRDRWLRAIVLSLFLAGMTALPIMTAELGIELVSIVISVIFVLSFIVMLSREFKKRIPTSWLSLTLLILVCASTGGFVGLMATLAGAGAFLLGLVSIRVHFKIDRMRLVETGE